MLTFYVYSIFKNAIQTESKTLICFFNLVTGTQIFVKVYEDRMDLLRAVIIGPKGTPYHNGLFFFDVCFPSTYPSRPPVRLLLLST